MAHSTHHIRQVDGCHLRVVHLGNLFKLPFLVIELNHTNLNEGGTGAR